jgi:hypothetical protein
MRKLILILLAFFAACTFLRALDTVEAAEIPVEIIR